MYICIYVCIHLYIYVYIYIHVCGYVFICMYEWMYVYICVCVCVCVRLYAFVCVCIYVYSSHFLAHTGPPCARSWENSSRKTCHVLLIDVMGTIVTPSSHPGFRIYIYIYIYIYICICIYIHIRVISLCLLHPCARSWERSSRKMRRARFNNSRALTIVTGTIATASRPPGVLCSVGVISLSRSH